MSQPFHVPVLLAEVLDALKIQPGGRFIDGTAGGGGHAIELAKQVGSRGRVLGLDLDEDALQTIRDRAEQANIRNIELSRENFKNIESAARQSGMLDADGVLLDLGVSSFQLDSAAKGFGFAAERLDMRMDARSELTAAAIVNTWDEAELVRIFRDYGEEVLAKPIARAIIGMRKRETITRPEVLARLAHECYVRRFRGRFKKHPATKIFMALRIAVNDEMANLEAALRGALAVMRPGGRLCVIAYHSLEDRRVKNFFRQESKDCICPADLPVCQCQHKKILNNITKKPIIPTDQEIAANPRSRSAKLRVAEKI